MILISPLLVFFTNKEMARELQVKNTCNGEKIKIEYYHECIPVIFKRKTMNIGQEIFDSFVFHDAVFNSISFDIEARVIRMIVENESENGKLEELAVVFSNVSNFNFDAVDFFKISEINSLQIIKNGDLYRLEMIVLLGFGEPSGLLCFDFLVFEATMSK